MALTRITKGVIKPNENYDTHNINSTGIITATALNVSGNASIGGVLTYEDVTSIDSVGLITARGGIDCNGDLDVDGQTSLDHTTIAGIVTFQSGSGLDLATNNISAGMRIINNGNPSSDGMYIGYGNANNGTTRLFGGGSTNNPTVINSTGVSIPLDLDVDGHTNLDNVSIAGVSTFTGNITVQNASVTDTKITIESTGTNSYPALRVKNDARSYDLGIDGATDAFRIYDVTGTAERLRISSTGNVSIGNNATPDTLLHLQGDKPKLRIESTNTLEASLGTEEIARIEFEGTKGSNRNVAASLRVRQDGTWSTVDDWFSPTAIEFYTQDQSGTEITTPRLTINRDGKVGIGSVTPAATLDLQSTDTEVLLRLNTKPVKNGYLDIVSDANRRGIIRFQDTGGTTRWSIGNGDSDELTNTSFHISSGNSGGGSAKFVIDSGGKIKLGSGGDVVGSANVEIRYDNPVLLIRDTAETSADNDAKIGFGNNTHYPVAYMSHVWDGTNGALTFHTRLSGNESEKLRIDSAGDIFIGTSTDIAPTNGTNLCVSDATISRLILEKQSTIKYGLNVSSGFTIYDETNDAARFNITSDGKVGINQSTPLAGLHVGTVSGINTAFQVGTISGTNRYFVINHMNNQQNFYQVKMRVNDNGLIPMLDLGNPYGGTGFGTKIKFSGYNDSEVAAIEVVNTANNSSSAVDMVFNTGGTNEVMRLASDGEVKINGSINAGGENDPQFQIRNESGTNIQAFKHYFSVNKNSVSGNATNKTIVDIDIDENFHQAGFEVTYFTRLQGVSDQQVRPNKIIFGVNRFNGAGSQNVTKTVVEQHSEAASYCDVNISTVSATNYVIRVEFSSSTNVSSFAAGWIEGVCAASRFSSVDYFHGVRR